MENKERLQVALVLKARQKRKHNRTPPLNRHTPPSPKDLIRETLALAERSYDGLEGQWHDWLEVARRFEHKAQAQDRLDLRHTIIVAFADQQARNERLGKPDLSFYGMLRIASHCVADYWRERLKMEVKVCVYSGLPTEPHCASCKRYQGDKCPYLALRPIESLDQLPTDYLETLADDSIDIEAWLERSTWELGYPKRLVAIAQKIDNEALSAKDRMYLSRYRHKEQKPLF